MSLSEIMNKIQSAYVETQKVSKIIEKKNQESYEMKVSLNRLNIQIEKQS